LTVATSFELADDSASNFSLNFMPAKVRIPTPLRKLTNEQELVEVSAGTIATAVAELQAQFPGIKERLLDEKGEVRRFVNVYVNEEDIRFLENQATPVKDGDEISIIPAIAGG
jgi:molybdopterin synthase sulfur carrier subunit